ncbi:MAG: OmpA family protein [Prevotellaceae bacterium]|nr:OmpA family protein [Prevotella sp.]MDD7256854.1 OmpA family protein [Prevotellaceae bacterium]MDY6130134.1 OmpA family protein [Prevotella sp.]
MKNLKTSVLGLCTLMLLSGCSNMTNTTKGGIIGGAGGAALGGLIGQIIGKDTKGTVIGAAIGTAVGTTAGVLIGKKMDKAKAAAEAVENAQVESITDANGLQAVKVTFDSGILFPTGSSALQASAKKSLSEFANVLISNADADVAIKGYTDNAGWKNSTPEQSIIKNQNLSLQRAQSVQNYLTSNGVSYSQIKTVEGLGEANPVADNSTAAGKAQNRRVEVYLYASKQMIEAANNGTLK